MREEVEKHYEHYFGTGKVVLKSTLEDGSQIRVLEFDKTKERPYVVLATSGMSSSVMKDDGVFKMPVKNPRIEMFVYLETKNTEIAQMLVDVASYVYREKTFIHWMHILPLGRRCAEGSSLKSLVFRVPRFEGKTFSQIETKNGDVQFLWACPVWNEERIFARTKGLEALENKLDKLGTDLFDLKRKCVVKIKGEN